MKLYLCQDRTWAGTQADAKARGKDFDTIEVPTDKPGLLSFLNQQANAVEDLRPVVAPAPVATIAPSYSDQSVATDEAFEALPLARQLHLAALALENARTAIKPLARAA